MSYPPQPPYSNQGPQQPWQPPQPQPGVQYPPPQYAGAPQYGAPQQQAPWAPPPPAKVKPWVWVVIGVGTLVLLGIGGGYFGNDASRNSPSTAAQVKAVSPTQTPPRTGSPDPLSPPEPAKKVAMPDVRGQNGAIAGDYLAKLGFTNVQFGSQDPLDSWVVLPENWTVKKQSTKAGTKISTDTLIVLTCTKLS